MNPNFYIWRKKASHSKPGKTRQGMTRHVKARPGEARQGKTRWRPGKKVSPGFEKYCISFMVFSRKTTYSAGVLEQRFAWSTPNRKCTGLCTSLPNINLLGVKPELRLTLKRISLLIWGRYRSQSRMFFSRRQHIICNTVLFMRSIWQFEHRRYPVVRVLVICKNSQRTVNKLLMKFFPWSVWSSKQRPNLEKNSSTMVFATNSADCSGNG